MRRSSSTPGVRRLVSRWSRPVHHAPRQPHYSTTTPSSCSAGTATAVPEVVLAEPLAYAGPSKHGPDPEPDLHHSLSVSTRYPLLTANNCAELGHDRLGQELGHPADPDLHGHYQDDPGPECGRRREQRCLRDIGSPEGGNQGS